MQKIFRALLAGWGAKKIGGGKCGCIGAMVEKVLPTNYLYIFLQGHWATIPYLSMRLRLCRNAPESF